MADRDRRPAGLDVVGQLAILADDAPFDVEFRGNVVVVSFASLGTATRLRRMVPRRERRLWAQRLVSTLDLAGLGLQVRVGNRQVARLDRDGPRGWVARWLGVDPLRLDFAAILATLFGRRVPTLDGRATGPRG